MQEELNQFERQDAWELVDSPHQQKAIADTK